MYKDIKGVIFDLDNTILATSRVVSKARMHVYEEMKKDFDYLDEELFKSISDRTYQSYGKMDPIMRDKTTFYGIFRDESRLMMEDEKVRKYSEIFEKYVLNRLEFTEGIEEVIGKLREKGLKLGLLTGEGLYKGAKRKMLDNILLLNDFDVKIIARDDIPEDKNDPKAFIKTAELIGLRPIELLYVGDMPDLDIDNAKEAGMTTVLFDRYNREKGKVSRHHPDFVIEDMKDLYRILEIRG